MSRILVVEDDADLQFIYDNTLSRKGHDVLGARRAEDAFALLATERFDLVILDINLPDRSGLRILESIRQDARLQAVPVVVVSANEQYGDQTAALGARYFMIKPVPLVDLMSVVIEVLNPRHNPPEP
jgi:two-component system sensor histidine kinase and response regulator WspE